APNVAHEQHAGGRLEQSSGDGPLAHGRQSRASLAFEARRYDRPVAAEITPEHPNLPRRGALGTMFVAIALSGSLGGLIGYSLVATTCPDTPTRAEQLLQQIRGFQVHVPSCAWKEFGGALVGTILAALGAATIAVLVLRAQYEWRGHAPKRISRS
ncbi:MAG: hypothetical protein QOI08_4110, partial [Actinomycetota bacterium]|nr:hypothetical protein [Actinomycetota bacterium]